MSSPNAKKLYTFRYKRWGVQKEEVLAFVNIKEAVAYAIQELPKHGYTDIQPPKEHNFLKK